MRFLKRKAWKAEIGVSAVLVLVFALCMTGKAPENTYEEPMQSAEILQEESARPEVNAEAPESKPVEKPVESPKPVEPQEEKKELYCTLSVRCDTILNDISRLDEDKRTLVGNAVIFPQKKVSFNDGESVFDVLLREMKENKIHLEFVNTPVYNSVYIEGIGNIYEFDAGELSGWMYKVNGEFPNYGCSKYILQNGDRVEFVYTCDLGKDVGNRYTSNNGG